MRAVPSETRSIDRLRAHYEIEKELARRLRDASKEDRRHLYSAVYDELFRRVLDHPQLTAKSAFEGAGRNVDMELALLQPLVGENMTFMEIGPGDCAVSFKVARLVKKVYAVDVSDEITRVPIVPPNFTLALSDGCSIPVPESSVDVVFSNQLMEHLHPDDAHEQLRNIYRAMRPGGLYVCITPNRLNGPHDISMYFDAKATGFHLHEYTVSELYGIFKAAGFSKIKLRVGGRGKFINLPVFLSVACEQLLSLLPQSLSRRLAASLPFRPMLEIRMLAYK